MGSTQAISSKYPTLSCIYIYIRIYILRSLQMVWHPMCFMCFVLRSFRKHEAGGICMDLFCLLVTYLLRASYEEPWFLMFAQFDVPRRSMDPCSRWPGCVGVGQCSRFLPLLVCSCHTRLSHLHMCNVFFALDTWAVALLAAAAWVVLALSIFEPSQGFFAFYAGSVGPTGQCHPFQWGKEALPCANEGIILPWTEPLSERWGKSSQFPWVPLIPS